MSPDLKDIRVEGNDAEVDAFAACITAAVDYWGRDYDYDFIAGLTGSAFSPVWWMEETCSAWWTEFGNDSRMDFLGEALGFQYRESPDYEPGVFKGMDELPPDGRRFWERVGEAVEAGKIVIMHTWPCWSIITEWNDDITKLGLASVSDMGGRLCAPYPTAKLYILSGGTVQYTRSGALKQALVFGADVADGTFKRPGFAYGGKLYEAILGKAGNQYFCGVCKEKSHSCVCRTMNRVAATNATAVRFLEFAGEFLGDQVPQPALEAVIKHYQAVAEYAGNYTDCELLKADWENNGFQQEFYKRVGLMQIEHKTMAKTFRRIADTLAYSH